MSANDGVPMIVFSREDVPLNSDQIREYYEKWRYPKIVESDQDEPTYTIIDKDGESHYGFSAKDVEIRKRNIQTDFVLEDYRNSHDLFRNLYSEFASELPNEVSKKKRIIYIKLVFGDGISCPSDPLIGRSTPLSREYANEFEYNTSVQQVSQREQVPRPLRNALIGECGNCAKCGSDEKLEIHHIIPYADGGTTER